MKNYYLLLPLFSVVFFNAQVGINTDTPQATLDVNGDLIIRNINTATTSSNYDFLVENPTSKKVEKVNGTLGNARNINTTMTKVTKFGSTGILGASIYSGYNRIAFNGTDVKIDPGSNFDSTTSTYKVPSDGVYAINFEYRYGNGVQLQLLSLAGTPRAAILKQLGATYTVLDERDFSGANVSLLGIGALSVIISQTQVNSFYRLSKDDVLSFEVYLGGIALSVLGNSFTAASIYKISD